MVLVRRLDSFAQAACLSCHPFTNLLSKIDKKMAGPPIFQILSLLIWDTSLKYVLFIFDKLAEVTELQKVLVRNVKI